MRPVSGDDLVAAALQSSLARAQRNYNSSSKFNLKKRLTPGGKGGSGSSGSGVNTESRGGGGNFGAVKSLIRNKKSLKFESEFSLWIQQTSEFNFTSEAYTNGAAVPEDIECLNSRSSGDKKKNKSKNFQNLNGSPSQPELTNGTVSSSLSLLKGKASQLQSLSQSNSGENSFDLLRKIKESRKEKKKLAKIRKRLLKQGFSSEDIEKLVSQCQTKNSGSDGGAISIVNKLRKALLFQSNKEKKKQEKENQLIQNPKNKKKLKKMKDLLENGENSPTTPGTPPSTNHPRASTSASHSHSKSPQINGGGCGSPVACTSTGSGSQSQHQLPQPKRILYPREKIVPGYQEKLPVGAGFFNMGNSCYLNASLQAVFHVPAFINWLRQDSDHRRHCQENGSCTVCAMKKTLDASLNRQNSAPNAIRPVEIINRLRSICRHFSHGRQEDAHEFLRYLFESMERSYLAAINCLRLDNRSKETNPLSQIFGGYIRTEVTCLKCNHVSTTFQPTAELQLDIRHVTTLEDAILNHFKKERLDNNDYKCEKCKTISQATKQFSLEVPPIVLCIQLKRFTLYGTKIAKRIHCNRYLDMSKYMHKSKQVNGFSNLRYRLVALVTHLGASANCGHYTAIAEASNGNFYQFDDSYVHQVTVANALNNDAYVIIYEMDKRPSSGKDSGAVASTSSATSTSGGFTTNLTNFPSSTVTSSSVTAASASATMNSLFPKKLPSTPIPKISSSKLVNHNHTHENSGGGTKSESLNSNGNSNGFKTGSSLERNRISFGIRSPGLVTPKKINILKHSDVSLTGTRPASPKISSSSTSTSSSATSTSTLVSSTAASTSMNSVKLVPYNDDENEESDKDESSTTVKRLKSPGNRSPEIGKCPKSPKPETSTSASASTSNAPQSSTSRSGQRSKSPAGSEPAATSTNSSKLVPNETAERDTIKRKAAGSDSGSGSASDRRRRHSSTSSGASSSSNGSSNNDSSKRKGSGHKRKRSASRSEVSTATEKEKEKESRKSPPPQSSSRDSQERDRERRRDRNPSRSPSCNKNGNEEKEREKEKSAAGSVPNSEEKEKESKSGSTTSFDMDRLRRDNNIVGWNGRKSMLSMSMDDDRKRANEKTLDDEYDEEFDQGNVKKVRRSRSLPRESEGGGMGNRFQTVEDRKKEIGRWSHVAEDSGPRNSGGGRNPWTNGDHGDSSSFRQNNSNNRGFGGCSKPRHSSTGSSQNQQHVNNMGYAGMSSRNNQNHRSPFNRNGGGGGNQYRSQSYSSYNGGGKHWINRHH